MSDIELVKNIITKNIVGSFMVIMLRERSYRKFDFIDPIRISVYHFAILNEHKKCTFFDIMDIFTDTLGNEFEFSKMNLNEDKISNWISDRDIKQYNTTKEEVIENLIEIFTNTGIAMLNTRHPLYHKMGLYKTNILQGKQLPLYKLKIIQTKFKEFQLIKGEDVINKFKLKRSFLKQVKKNL